MSQDKSKEFSLEGLDDPILEEGGENPDASDLDDGFEFNLSEDLDDLDLGGESLGDEPQAAANLNEFSLTNVKMPLPVVKEGEDHDLGEAPLNELDLGDDSDKFEMSDLNLEHSEVQLNDDDLDMNIGLENDLDLNDLSDVKLFDEIQEDSAEIADPLKDYSSPKLHIDTEDLTEDVKAKLKEIDAIMEEDATNASFKLGEAGLESENSSELFSENESIVEDVNIDKLHLDDEEEAVEKQTGPKKKKKKETEAVASASIEEISQAYTGEMERTQATIANLRADRDELLKKIDLLEEEKLLGSRNSLTLRAELDEKKIELTIIRKKLNEEINDLKDRVRLYEEKVLILEEKNKHLVQEIDKAGQKNKIDVKRVMLRERELEQKLELLKADAETQIRNRDLKILELKRRIDAMEFDMESMTQQEKKTLESRFELEDKLDKAIRTLRTAISNLEDEGNRNTTLDALKKNVEM